MYFKQKKKETMSPPPLVKDEKRMSKNVLETNKIVLFPKNIETKVCTIRCKR